MTTVRSSLFAVLVFLLQSCAATRPDVAQWPEGVPEPEQFIAAWEADEDNRDQQARDDYLTWVQRFFLGFNLAPGWNSMTDQVVARLDPAEAPLVRERLAKLGVRVGQEWAKSNQVRLIDTRMAATWSDALQEALRQDDLPNFLERFEADIDALLAGELVASRITFERYYVDEFDF